MREHMCQEDYVYSISGVRCPQVICVIDEMSCMVARAAGHTVTITALHTLIRRNRLRSGVCAFAMRGRARKRPDIAMDDEALQ